MKKTTGRNRIGVDVGLLASHSSYETAVCFFMPVSCEIVVFTRSGQPFSSYYQLKKQLGCFARGEPISFLIASIAIASPWCCQYLWVTMFTYQKMTHLFHCPLKKICLKKAQFSWSWKHPFTSFTYGSAITVVKHIRENAINAPRNHCQFQTLHFNDISVSMPYLVLPVFDNDIHKVI